MSVRDFWDHRMEVFDVNGDYWHMPKDPTGLRQVTSSVDPHLVSSLRKALKVFWLNNSKDDLSACFKDHA